MLFDTSTASIISIPVRVTSLSFEPNCGRASATTSSSTAAENSTNL